MNTSTFIPSWEVSGYVSLLDLDFGTYVPVVESEPIIELNGQYSELTCDVLNGQFTELAYPLMSPLTCDVLNGQYSDVLEGWVNKASELTCHISDGWFGQCCDLADAPKPIESKSEQLAEVEARVAKACAKMAHRSAYASPVRYGTPVNTTTTTKSGKVVQVSPHAVTPHGNAPVANCITSPKVTSAIGEASVVSSNEVSTFKSTLFNLDEFDVVKQATQDLLDMFSPDEYNTLRDKYGVDVMKKAFNTLQGDVRTRIRLMINEANTIRNGIELTVVATQTPKAPATPKPSTAKFANNFNSLVMAKYRELNGGVIRDSLILNKLTSALRANNIEAYNKYVTTFNNPTAVALHRQAYDAVISAS